MERHSRLPLRGSESQSELALITVTHSAHGTSSALFVIIIVVHSLFPVSLILCLSFVPVVLRLYLKIGEERNPTHIWLDSELQLFRAK